MLFLKKLESMMNKFFSLLKWLFFIAYSVVCYIFLVKTVQPELHFHFQQPPFLFDKFFFQQYVSYPGGISEYISTFLMQLFYFKRIGALVILAIGLLLTFTIFKIFRIFSQNEYSFIWIIIPFVAYISLFNDYCFPFAVSIKILFTFFATWLFLYFTKDFLKAVISFLIICPLLYYLAGSGACFIFSVTAPILYFYLQKPKFALYFLIIAGLCAFTIPYLAYKYVFGISSKHLFFSILPDVVNYLAYRPTKVYYVFCYSLPSIALILFVYSKLHSRFFADKSKNKNNSTRSNNGSIFSNQWIAFGISVIIIVFSTYYVFNKTINIHKKNIVACDYYCYTEQWSDAIDIAISDSRYDYLINLNYNRAIDQTGHFVDWFYSYPQLLGDKSLYPDYLYLGETLLTASDYYYDLGYISESRHWAYDYLVYLPYSQRALKSATLSHLILGEYMGAQKCLNILNKGIVSSDFVKKYQPMVDDTSLVAKDPVLMLKRNLIPKEQELTFYISNRFNDLLEANPQNKRAYEHLLMYYMLNHKLGNFIENLAIADQYYETLPEIFQQAVLMYCLYKRIAIPDNFKINRETIVRFNEFTKTLIKDKGNNNLAKSELSDKYWNTYMFYTKFVSPKVTKSVFRERKESDPIN
jgi:hypothetical protein